MVITNFVRALNTVFYGKLADTNLLALKKFKCLHFSKMLRLVKNMHLMEVLFHQASVITGIMVENYQRGMHSVTLISHILVN